MLAGWLLHPDAGALLWPISAASVLAVLAGSALHGLGGSPALQERERGADRLLAEALGALSQLPTRAEILERLPKLLAELSLGHVTVLTRSPAGDGLLLLHSSFPMEWPAERVLPWTSVCGRSWRSGQPIYVADVRSDPGYLPYPGRPTRCDLALPLRQQGEVTAVLNLEDTLPLSPWRQSNLTRFATTVGHLLSTLAEREEARLSQELARSMAGQSSLEQAAEQVDRQLREALGLSGTRLLLIRRGRLQLVAGENTGSEPGAELPAGAVSEPRFDDRAGTALLPIQVGPRPRALLEIHYLPGSLSAAQRTQVSDLASLMGPILSRFLTEERTATLLRLERELFELPEEQLLGQLLESAVTLVPGAEAGSLTLRGADDRFRHCAWVGYTLEGLAGPGMSEEDERRWYHAGEAGWEAGEPRVLRGEQVRAISRLGENPGAGLSGIAANLCIPVRYGGKVLAILNLDARQDPQAFQDDSCRAARLFATQLAAILHEADSRRRLAEAARRDPLTNLANRRDFDLHIREWTARSLRHREPLALMILDLQGFKAINDRLGHARGDTALLEVSQALEQSCRADDLVFRWGGDEFALLLPKTGAEGAYRIALRLAERIGQLRVEGIPLGANIGLACTDQDGQDQDRLLALADQRMYWAKQQALACLPISQASGDGAALD